MSALVESGARFDRLIVPVGSSEVPFIGRRALLANKRAAGRLRDLSDSEALEGTILNGLAR